MLDPTAIATSSKQLLDILVERKVLKAATAQAINDRDPLAIAMCLPDAALIDALKSRHIISSDEAKALHEDEALADFYECECESPLPEGETFDSSAYEKAGAEIRYGNLAEALIQTSRILPGLDRLADLAARNAKGA